MAYEVDNLAIMSIAFEGLLFGQQTITTMHYQFVAATGPVDGTTAISVARTKVNTAGSGLYPNYTACISRDVQNLRQYYQWITPTRYAYVEFVPTSDTGEVDEDCIAPNLAYVLTRRGQLATRSNISNLHLPGVVASAVDGGYVTEGQRANLGQFGQASVNNIDLAGLGTLIPVAFHRANSAISAQLFTYYPAFTIRELRRRTVGLGS